MKNDLVYKQILITVTFIARESTNYFIVPILASGIPNHPRLSECKHFCNRFIPSHIGIAISSKTRYRGQ